MKVWRVVSLAMLVWGNLAFANLPSGGNAAQQELQTISSWMAHLNYYYPDLAVSARLPQDRAERKELMNELNLLEGFLQGDHGLPNASLKQIACGRPVCDGGGDGGKCKTCQVDEQ